MIRPTGSKIHRVWKCPGSAVLPQVDRSESSPAAERGKAIHAYLERARDPEVGRDQAMALAPVELRPLLSALDLDDLPGQMATEVALAYDWRARTGRELARNRGRIYAMPGAMAAAGIPPLGPTEIPMTIDLLGASVHAPTVGYVGDYKSGHTKYPPPDRFGQTLLGALAARGAYGYTHVFVELIFVHDDGDHHSSRRRLDEWDLDVFADELAAAMELAFLDERARGETGQPPSVSEGPHCDYCPAYKNCPAKLALVRTLPKELGGFPREGEITIANASDVWMALERVEEVIHRIKAEVVGLAASGDIPLPDGRVIGHVITRREALDGAIAAAVIEQAYGREARDETVDVKVSKDALKQCVIKHLKPKEKITTKREDGVFDRVMAEIRRRGGAAISTTDNVKPHAPRKKKLGA